jgi:hypothetical protein
MEKIKKELENINNKAPKEMIFDLSNEYPERNKYFLSVMNDEKYYFMYSYKNKLCYTNGIIIIEVGGYRDNFTPIITLNDFTTFDDITIIGKESHRKSDYDGIGKILSLYK